MADITISLDPEALREATVQAMVGVLTDETKEKMIQQSIKAILMPSTNNWDKGKSPIEQAFQNAITTLAHQECLKLVKEDEGINAKIKELLRITAEKVLDADQEKMAEKMAESFINSIKSNY